MMTIFSQPLLYTFIFTEINQMAACCPPTAPDPNPNPNPNPNPDPDPIPQSRLPTPTFSNSPLPCIIDTVYLTI